MHLHEKLAQIGDPLMAVVNSCSLGLRHSTYARAEPVTTMDLMAQGVEDSCNQQSAAEGIGK
jgi:hypothetical protein